MQKPMREAQGFGVFLGVFLSRRGGVLDIFKTWSFWGRRDVLEPAPLGFLFFLA